MMVLVLFSNEKLVEQCGYLGSAEKGTIAKVGYAEAGPLEDAWIKLVPDMDEDCPWLPPRTFKYLKERP